MALSWQSAIPMDGLEANAPLSRPQPDQAHATGPPDFFAKMDEFNKTLHNLTQRVSRGSSYPAPARPVSIPVPDTPTWGTATPSAGAATFGGYYSSDSTLTLRPSSFQESTLASAAAGSSSKEFLPARSSSPSPSARSSVKDFLPARSSSPFPSARSSLASTTLVRAPNAGAPCSALDTEAEVGVSDRIAQLERKLIRRERDSERLTAVTERLKLENGELRATMQRSASGQVALGTVDEFESSSYGGSVDSAETPLRCSSQRIRSQPSSLPWNTQLRKPALVRPWVPLCASSSGTADALQADDTAEAAADDWSADVFNSIPDQNRPVDADGFPLAPIDENVFRRGTLWLWGQQLAKMDPDVMDLLSDDYLDRRKAKSAARRRDRNAMGNVGVAF